jgi:hypothetical protein
MVEANNEAQWSLGSRAPEGARRLLPSANGEALSSRPDKHPGAASHGAAARAGSSPEAERRAAVPFSLQGAVHREPGAPPQAGTRDEADEPSEPERRSDDRSRRSSPELPTAVGVPSACSSDSCVTVRSGAGWRRHTRGGARGLRTRREPCTFVNTRALHARPQREPSRCTIKPAPTAPR